MKKLATLKTEYVIVIVATLFWISDFLMDLYVFSGNFDSAYLSIRTGTFIHLPVFAAQLLFTLYVLKVIRESRALEESLKTAKIATDRESEKVNAIMEAMVRSEERRVGK